MLTRSPRLAFFVHGLGFNGPVHGRGLAAGAQAAGWDIYFSRANAGSSKIGTMLSTLDGIEAGGLRVAAELRQVLATQHWVTDVALVGASMGGMYCRYAASLLWPPLQDAACVGPRPAVLVTLASPHLGIHSLYGEGGAKLAVARHLSRSVQDLYWDTAALADLAQGDTLAALGKFNALVAYAPLMDDGIVSYPSAAIRPSAARSPNSAESVGAVRASRVVDAATDWVGSVDESFVRDNAEVAQNVHTAAVALLSSGPAWTVVDVAVTHKVAASLHPGVPGVSELCEDLWRRLAVNS